MKSALENSAIEVVALEPALTLTPVKSILPIELPPVFTKSVLKSIFKIFISWSFVNFSVGVNSKFFVPVFVISVEKSPNFKVVKSVVFSSKYALSVVVKTTNSDSWTSWVSGSIIWTR